MSHHQGAGYRPETHCREKEPNQSRFCFSSRIYETKAWPLFRAKKSRSKSGQPKVSAYSLRLKPVTLKPPPTFCYRHVRFFIGKVDDAEDSVLFPDPLKRKNRIVGAREFERAS